MAPRVWNTPTISGTLSSWATPTAEASARAARDIDATTKRALGELREEVANLTVLATEKVTRKVLDSSDQKRLVEEALGELDFSGISSGASDN